jgi:hypothetical protein
LPEIDLALLKKLRPCIFKYDPDKLSDKIADGKIHIGFIAQDLAELFPKDVYGIVNEDPVGLKVNYIEFIPLLVKWTQLLLERVESQDEELRLLKSEIVALNGKIKSNLEE